MLPTMPFPMMLGMLAVLLWEAGLAAGAATLLPPNGTAVPDEYIIVLEANATDVVLETVQAAVKGTSYQIGSFRAVHAKLDTVLLTQTLSMAGVAYVEHNLKITVDLTCPAKQDDASSWGQRRTTSSSSFAAYAHDPEWGKGVDAYIIDTGIMCAHKEFESRCLWGTNTATGSSDGDKHGHGTHVAGTVGGRQYGIAKGTTLIAVKVLGDDGSGTTAWVIGGVQWTVQNARKRGRPSLANMSLGSGRSLALNSAVSAAVNSGVSIAVAAGNDNKDACQYSPASAAEAITVGSIREGDFRSGFSNYGTCLDVFAPGSSIKAAYIGSTTQISTLSGTSMAAPHVAGVMAAYLTGKTFAHPPADVTKWIEDTSVSGHVSNRGDGSPDRLLHVLCTRPPTAPPKTATPTPVPTSTPLPTPVPTPAKGTTPPQGTPTPPNLFTDAPKPETHSPARGTPSPTTTTPSPATP
eukprot:Sspe_Gene.62131::Locus_34714_Transcript_1_1_Confidence_1.000_Length_1426::g.62131::m.62131/K01336/E3.4.21.48; cerevisin